MIKYRHIQITTGNDLRINPYMFQSCDRMTTRASKKLMNGYCINMQRLIVGAPYDKQIEFRTVRERVEA